MQRRTKPKPAYALLFAMLACFLASNARAQTSELFLNEADLANLDLLASNTAEKIRTADPHQQEPKILVIDFFRGSLGATSSLGSILADRFSEALKNSSAQIKVLDRKLLSEYLRNNWTTLEDLRNGKVCELVGRQLGATGVILGRVHEENGFIALKVHLEGFGLPDKESDIFSSKDEFARLMLTDLSKNLLSQPGPNYARPKDVIPDEPDIAKAGTGGAGMPACTYCPNPGYSDAARAGKFQGVVILSVVITGEGKLSSIYVIRSAPFGLTAIAIGTVQRWQFRPAKKNGNPVSVRVPIEITFRLF